MALKPHPLDPLSAGEVSKSSKIIRENYPNEKWIFNSITLKEPEKSLLLDNTEQSLDVIHREAFLLLIEAGTGQVVEAVVDLLSETIEKFTRIPSGNQPTLTPEDCLEAERIAKSDQGVRLRCAKLGFSDMELVAGDPWSVGYLDDRTEFEGMRLVQLFMYGRLHENDNHYAHPFNFVVLTDLTTRKVVCIEDLPTGSGGGSQNFPVRVPQKPGNYHPEFLGNDFLRSDVKPLEVTSPSGPSFTVTGNLIEWQKFSIRISFNYREGLVLHNVTYTDGDTVRPLLYRASLCEMAVPYGEPKPPFHRKCAFDVSDYGLGFCTNSLELGCDCFGTIKYFDVVLNNHNGEPYTIKNAICLHEEDDGILFKHTEYRNGKVAITRSRRLVVSFVVTVVNYEYCLYWSFYQDGTIKFDVKATGELSTNPTTHATTPPHGVLVSPNVEAQIHQHIFVARLDMMIDGIRNTVSTLDVKPVEELPGGGMNPYGQGFRLVETPLRTTTEAQTKPSPDTFRVWKISNESSIHPTTKEPVSWKLIPTNPCKLLASPESYISKKAEFAKNSIWVTPYNENEMFPSGFYVLNKGAARNGIGNWVKEERYIENEDVVLWHVFGMTHCPRIEDFPIMSVESAGFTLKPNNFFVRNGGLDVPPPKGSHGDSK